MKKNLLIVLIAFSTLDVFSQIGKGIVIFSGDGNCMKTTTENGVFLDQNVVQIKNLSIGTSVGYFTTDRFIVGVGLDYYWNKESRANQKLINKFFQGELTKMKSNAFLPNIYFGYYYPIINKLYINTNLKLSYGKLKSDYHSFIGGGVQYGKDTMIVAPDPSDLNYVKEYEGNSKVDFFSVKLFPELTYFMTSNCSLCLGLGGIEYSLSDWKTDNSNFVLNFNPAYWRLGIKFKI
jgi:hypothetical protein